MNWTPNKIPSHPAHSLVTVLTELTRLIIIIIMVKLSLCLTNAMKTYGGVDVYTHVFFTFTPRPLYSQGKSPWYPFNRRLGGPQSWSGRHGEVKILAPTGTRTPAPWSSSYPCSHNSNNNSLFIYMLNSTAKGCIIMIKLPLCSIKSHTMSQGSWDIASCILNLGTRYWWLVRSQDPLDRRFGGLVRLCWTMEKWKVSAHDENRTPNSQLTSPLPSRYIDWVTAAHNKSNSNNNKLM
jgi:hypothetical protein